MAFKYDKNKENSYANIVVAEVNTPLGVAAIRVSADTSKATIKVKETGQTICSFKDGLVKIEKYNKKDNNVLTNIINTDRTENDCCRVMIHTVSKKTGKPIHFCKNYTYEDCAKIDGRFMFKN